MLNWMLYSLAVSGLVALAAPERARAAAAVRQYGAERANAVIRVTTRKK